MCLPHSFLSHISHSPISKSLHCLSLLHAYFCCFFFAYCCLCYPGCVLAYPHLDDLESPVTEEEVISNGDGDSLFGDEDEEPKVVEERENLDADNEEEGEEMEEEEEDEGEDEEEEFSTVIKADDPNIIKTIEEVKVAMETNNNEPNVVDEEGVFWFFISAYIVSFFIYY